MNAYETFEIEEDILADNINCCHFFTITNVSVDTLVENEILSVDLSFKKFIEHFFGLRVHVVFEI